MCAAEPRASTFAEFVIFTYRKHGSKCTPVAQHGLLRWFATAASWNVTRRTDVCRRLDSTWCMLFGDMTAWRNGWMDWWLLNEGILELVVVRWVCSLALGNSCRDLGGQSPRGSRVRGVWNFLDKSHGDESGMLLICWGHFNLVTSLKVTSNRNEFEEIVVNVAILVVLLNQGYWYQSCKVGFVKSN